MKQFILVLIIISSCLLLFAEDYLTVYNNNQALFKSDIELNLKSGTQFYSFENIPTGIITESVIFIPKNSNVNLLSQNFEYDMANTQKMIQKYIGKAVKISTEEEQYQGTLIFYDFTSYGLHNETTNELHIINGQKVNSIRLSEMPTDFYLKPTLRWQLSTNRDGKYSADLSYLTQGVEWRATYNAILNKNDFTLNSWVTINNRSGKDFSNVNLKLIAGNVQTHQQMRGKGMDMGMPRSTMAMDMAPSFEERAFSDFRIYTLDQKVDIDNLQEKQLALYPLKTVKYTRKYEYTVQGSAVDIIISFKNSKANGLGLPLPKGNINFYEIDDKDGTKQFVGMSQINNTSDNQEVNLRTGSAFDIIGETKILNSTTSGRTRETDYEVTLTNNKKEAVEVEVIRQIAMSNVEILNPSQSFEKKDAYTYIWKVRVPAGAERKVTFKERVSG